jgi:hypothetical protein
VGPVLFLVTMPAIGQVVWPSVKRNVLSFCKWTFDWTLSQKMVQLLPKLLHSRLDNVPPEGVLTPNVKNGHLCLGLAAL